MNDHDPKAIISRFNKHKSVRDKYVSKRGVFDQDGERLLEMYGDPKNYTVVTSKKIVGCWQGVHASENHPLGVFDYEIIDADGNEIADKSLLSDASGVRVNGRSCFWLPKDAVLPFCNLLNFFT